MTASWRLRLPLIFIVALVDMSARASSWREVQMPTSGPARAIGAPIAGCLAGAVPLPFDGPGFEVVHISRHRYFGHPQTVAFVEALGRRAKALSLPPFYVGDMALPRGGPTPSGHVSHETGLDVDIWLNLEPKPALAPVAREEVYLPSMVLANGKSIDPEQFGRKQVELLRLAATDPRVDRIFVNPAIKRALCRGYAGAGAANRSWLHRIRPWYGHERHFHVRLKCPAGSPRCVSQPAVPPGDGCDATLAWWFEPHKAAPDAPRPKRILPASCDRLLTP